jgi:hypothetical protein
MQSICVANQLGALSPFPLFGGESFLQMETSLDIMAFLQTISGLCAACGEVQE